MRQSLTLSKEDIVETFMKQVVSAYPEATIAQGEDNLHWNVELETGKSLVIYLGNVWDNYKRTNDINVVSSFIDTQIEMFKLLGQMEEGGPSVNTDIVYPVFRSAGFSTNAGEASKEHDKTTLSDDFSEALKVMYVQDHPQFVSFVIEDSLPDGWTGDMLADKAFSNLKKQGWVPPVETMKLSDLATIHVFNEGDKQYQAQFMVREMYEEHLGDYFFIGMPTRELTVVIQWNQDPDKHVQEAIHYTMTLKGMVLDMYSNQANPLTHALHRVSDGDIKLLG